VEAEFRWDAVYGSIEIKTKNFKDIKTKKLMYEKLNFILKNRFKFVFENSSF